MTARELLWTHRYAEAIQESRRLISINPNDFGAMAIMGSALRALGRYKEAIPLFERIGSSEQSDKTVLGRPGRQMDISCVYWCLGDYGKAIQLMHDMVKGVLDGSIQFGDAAGAVTQGLLLYYMGVTSDSRDATSFALSFIRNRARRSAIKSWPGPVALYYLGDMTFSDVLLAATGKRDLSEAVELSRVKLLGRRRLCGALFHDGVRSRAEGAEAHCLARMRECYKLENPLIDQEWYLARYEVEGR
jgi:tetratricopeptide (TPR) repeat protein